MSISPDKGDTIIKDYPSQALALFDAILPNDVSGWPFGAGPTLERLIHARPALAADLRMIRLKGIWDRRQRNIYHDRLAL